MFRRVTDTDRQASRTRGPQAVRRRRASGLIAALAVACCVGALASPALAHSLKYNVAFSVHTGRFISAATAGSIRTDESDTLDGPVATYQGLAIPRRGPASSTLHIKGFSLLLPSESTWERFGTGFVPTADGGRLESYDCTGHLATPKKPPVLQSGAGSARKHLNLFVQAAGDDLRAKGVSGKDPVPINGQTGCDAWYEDAPAFSPASSYMPDMLTAHVQVPLGDLRGLKKGQADKIDVTDADAENVPPPNCGSGSFSCTVQWHWKGVVNFRRTG